MKLLPETVPTHPTLCSYCEEPIPRSGEFYRVAFARPQVCCSTYCLEVFQNRLIICTERRPEIESSEDVFNEIYYKFRREFRYKSATGNLRGPSIEQFIKSLGIK